MDNKLDRLKPAGLPAYMQRWNIEGLRAYVAAMQAGITYDESMITEKTRLSQQPMPYLVSVISHFIVQTFCDSAVGFNLAWQWLHPISQRHYCGMPIDHQAIGCRAITIGRCIKNIVNVV